jgi:hypothetical protein
MNWSWGDNPVVFFCTVFGGFGAIGYVGTLILAWKKPLLVRFERIDVPVNTTFEDKLDFWRSSEGNAPRNEFAKEFPIPAKYSNHNPAEIRDLVWKFSV